MIKKEFHRSEFTALKGEITELLKNISANFQYALLVTGGIYAWLITTHRKEDEIPYVLPEDQFFTLGLFLPTILSSLLFALSLASFIRIGEMGDYLKRLERNLGHQQLGWEREFESHFPTFVPIYLFGWAVVLIGSWTVAIWLSRATNGRIGPGSGMTFFDWLF